MGRRYSIAALRGWLTVVWAMHRGVPELSTPIERIRARAAKEQGLVLTAGVWRLTYAGGWLLRRAWLRRSPYVPPAPDVEQRWVQSEPQSGHRRWTLQHDLVAAEVCYRSDWEESTTQMPWYANVSNVSPDFFAEAPDEEQIWAKVRPAVQQGVFEAQADVAMRVHLEKLFQDAAELLDDLLRVDDLGYASQAKTDDSCPICGSEAHLNCTCRPRGE